MTEEDSRTEDEVKSTVDFEHELDYYKPKKDHYNFYFTYKIVHPWWDAVALGMEDAQRKYLEKGVTITYEYMAPEAASAEDQTERLHEAAKRDFDVIGVDVADEEIISPVLDELVDSGKKVMTFSSSDAAEGCKRIAYVGNTHNYEDGADLTEALSNKDLAAEKENANNFRNMANTDSMTGVRNKHAYSEMEAFLNQRIINNEIDKLAVVVCDINGLKIVNDTLGHAAGDKLIKDASAMICGYFNHGAVYRIGGDEFVVILQEKGYDTMHEVITEINNAIEDNVKKKELVISIGYSELTPEDQMVHDVFERADQMMYKRKQELKQMGAPARPE